MEQYGIFALGTWSNYYSEWSNGRGRWTEGRRMFQGESLTPEQLREGPITTAQTPITRSSTVQSSDDSLHVPVSEMASALFSYFQHSGNDIVINALLGEHMTALVRSLIQDSAFCMLINSIRLIPLRSGRNWLANGKRGPTSSLDSAHDGMVTPMPFRTPSLVRNSGRVQMGQSSQTPGRCGTPKKRNCQWVHSPSIRKVSGSRSRTIPEVTRGLHSLRS